MDYAPPSVSVDLCAVPGPTLGSRRPCIGPFFDCSYYVVAVLAAQTYNYLDGTMEEWLARKNAKQISIVQAYH